MEETGPFFIGLGDSGAARVLAPAASELLGTGDGGAGSVTRVLHLTSGDVAGEKLGRSGLPGEVFVWHDILYDGPREPGWPGEEVLRARAVFLEEATGGGLGRELVLRTLRDQYEKLGRAAEYEGLILWFDACLFDQAMLAHVLSCLPDEARGKAELLCVDAFPGIDPYDGLGQLRPEHFASVYGRRRPVTAEQFAFAAGVDRAFATQDRAAFLALARGGDAPLPWVPAAVTRWLREQPDPATGLGRLEALVLEALRSGASAPPELFRYVAAHDDHPLFWGDVTLWAKVNGLTAREPPLVRVVGPRTLLPQWDGKEGLDAFRVFPAGTPPTGEG